MTVRGHQGRLWSLGLLVVVCVLALLLAGPTASAQAKDWRIDNMDVLLNVQENGDVLVDETITFAFEGSYTYVGRLVPTGNMQGMSDISVSDANGVALPEDDNNSLGSFSTFMEGSSRVIQINFDLTDASGTWTIHYRAEKVAQFGDRLDGLVWYVFDAETPVSIGTVKATVKLPGSIPPDQMTSEAQVGYGVQWSSSSPAPSTVVYEAAGFPPYTSFWVTTGFPKGIVKDVWTARRVFNYIIPKIGLFLPFLAFLSMFLIWFRRGRDQPGATYAKYVSEPPSDLSPGLVGALIDERVDTKEVIATIVDLAGRGYLEMTDTQEGQHFKKPLTTFTRKKSFNDLDGFEKKTAESLFELGSDDEVTTAQLKNHFYTRVAPIVGDIYSAVASAGLFHRNPKKARSRWVGYGFLVGAVLAVLTFALRGADITGWGWFATGSVISTIIVWAFAGRMPQRTPKGAQEQKKWEAFRNYLEDLTRFTDMDTAKEKYEKYLPYAIAFGVEKHWTQRFEDLTVPAPDWYHPPVIIMGSPNMGPIGGGVGGGIPGGLSGGGGGGGFSLDSLSNSLFSSLGNISNVMTSAPSSSGSGSHGAFGGGGFSGGGFSGGFGGGGGGGGFRAG
jgi:hypothetical protein